MKLHQLRYFQEVCRQHSITKAAEELHISQPAVSAAIRELEEEFGLKLFKRSHKKLILTTEGSYFSLEVEELLQRAKQIADDMTRLQKKNTSIRLGLPTMIEALEIPLLALFHKEHPEIRLELHHGTSLTLRKALQDDRIDIAIVSGNHTDPGAMASSSLQKIEIVYCVNQNHPYAREKSLSFTQVAQDDLVEIEGSQHFRETILERFHMERCTPRIQWSTTQLYTKIQLIRNGVAGGFLYRTLAEREPDLIAISLDPPLYYEIEMLWQKNAIGNETIQTLLEFARKHGVFQDPEEAAKA